MRLRAEASGDQYILHGLAGNVVPQPAHRLNDLGVSPAGFLSNTNDRFTDALLDAWPARLSVLCLGPLIRRVLHAPHPLAERRVADDRDQVLDPRSETLAMLDQPATLLIAKLDSLG